MERIYLQTIFLFLCIIANSQENKESSISSISMSSVNVSGGEAGSSRGSVAYSIGLVFYNNIEATKNTLSEGIQHAQDIESVVSLGVNQIQAVVYPNPTSNFVLIDVIDFKNEYTQYQLFDSKGGLLKNGSITTRITKLSMDNVGAATYFLKISFLNKFEKTYKILKN